MALLKVIEWSDNSHNTLVYKIDTKKNVIARGSALTVREGQAAVFCDKGRMADVFLPGYYKLDTDSLPVLTALLSWKYGFETPFKSEVYFVSTNRFTKQRWGTANPIMLRDPDFGAVRVRGYGTYSFRVKDPYVFMTELSGSHSTYRTEDISDHIRSMLVMAISDALGESGISVVDMAANLMELSDAVKASLEKRFSELGLELSDFNFENVSLPAELEKAMELYRKYDVYVISDEIWSDLILPGYHHIPTLSVSDDARRRTAAFYAPSKTFSLAGLIGSYHIIPDPWLRDRVTRQGDLSHYNSCNVLSLHALLGAYSDEGAQWLDELRPVLADNIRYACDFIAAHFPGVQVMQPQGTYMLFLDCTAWLQEHHMTLRELEERGARAGVVWQDGAAFAWPDSIRMNLALPHSRLVEAMERLRVHAFC